MRAPQLPITAGSETARTTDVGPLRITSASFPSRSSIPPHTHDRPCLAFMLEGSFDLSFPGSRVHACVPGSIFIEPAGATHCNCMGTAGASVLVVQPDQESSVLPRSAVSALLAPDHFRHAGLTILARRMAGEIADPDAVSPLALEGYGLELLAFFARERARRAGAPPRWLTDAEDLLRARFMELVTCAEVAMAVGVHPAHLARSFRRRHHCSIGRFVRSLRLEWAARQLSTTRRSIASLAIEAGFADQSHFTRRFREFAGATPERWRRATFDETGSNGTNGQ